MKKLIFLLSLFFLFLIRCPSVYSIYSGDISVSNQHSIISSLQTNTFTVKVKNTGSETFTADLHDEIWLDMNCNGLRDDLEVPKKTAFYIDAGVWTSQSIPPGTTKYYYWNKSVWVSGYCYIHMIFFCTKEAWDPAKGNACWEQAINGNLQLKANKEQVNVTPLTTETPSTFLYRMSNYYPRDTSWHEMWAKYNHTAIDYELSLAKELGVNTIRTFLFMDAKDYTTQIDDFLTTADNHGLKVWFNLFDDLSTGIGCSQDYYSMPDKSIEIIKPIITRYANDNRIVMWEIKNEIQRDWNCTSGSFTHVKDESDRQKQILLWVNKINQYIKSVDTKHPVTVSVNIWFWDNGGSLGLGWARKLVDIVDNANFHWYDYDEDYISHLNHTIDTIKSWNIGKKIIIGEFGFDTNQSSSCTPHGSENEQSNYLDAVLNISSKRTDGAGFWILLDFTKTGSDCSFGIYRTDYTSKSSVRTIKQDFACISPESSLSFSPNVYGGTTFTGTVSGMSNCDGHKVWIRMDPSGYTSCFCTLSGGACSCTLSAPTPSSTPTTYGFTAFVDKYNNNNFNDPANIQVHGFLPVYCVAGTGSSSLCSSTQTCCRPKYCSSGTCQYSGSGCPILYSWNGNDFKEIELLNIHAPKDQDVTFSSSFSMDPKDGKYEIILHEAAYKFWDGSHINSISLKDANGKECHLVSAVHSKQGDVLSEIANSDDKRVRTYPGEEIKLVYDGCSDDDFTFTIEGYNMKCGPYGCGYFALSYPLVLYIPFVSFIFVLLTLALYLLLLLIMKKYKII